ncbi:hypothetical protein J2810_004817 [Chryseobacterium rhizosphaerae]|uniref:DUF4421 family protein n=1 Tax=Chryseobacterium rhizosphaerae TaxID=395937 RepID=UPI002857154F|nr:DUF4421 family protein [Chryseobacterium rhizosphaerae]MDR6548727.1 hypothetical protein [Chryseobacterium rhizosphaerae]
MGLSKAIFVFLLSFFVFYGRAQGDTANIRSYTDQVMVRSNIDTNIESYIFSQGEGKNGNQMTFSINNKTRTSFSVDYKIISATLSFSPHFISGNNDDELKGKSSYTDFSLRLFPQKFIQTLYYKNVKGFYLENMKDFLPGWQEGKDPYIQFPDFRVQSFGGSTAYVLNENFSAKSIYTQGEWQKKSSGSWVPFLDYDLSIFTNLIEGQKSKETQYKIGANMGYFYNWVIGKKVHIAPYLALGLGGKFSSYYENLGDKSRVNAQYVTIRMEGGLHVGYNTDRFLFGGKMNFSAYAYDQKNNQTVENNNLYGLLYIGYRFAPPKVVKNTYDKIQKKIPVL